LFFLVSFATTGASTSSRVIRPGSERIVGTWLLACALLIFAMVVLGGVTRLTGSGLSMVSWKPLAGVIPPFSEVDWQAEFDHYRATPEYAKVNRGMIIAEFKTIFYFEYAHRMLGRGIGVVFVLPFLYLYFRQRIENRAVPRYLFMVVLGGLQGLLGWYMVQSGLVDVPHVSQYRLTAHLVAAVVIYSYILWVAFPLVSRKDDRAGPSAVGGSAITAALLIFLTLLSGGFVAGLKAGFAFNTFPLMAGQFVPPGYFALDPVWRNFFDNSPAVQFNHRYIGVVTYLMLWIFILRAWGDEILGRHRLTLVLLLLTATAQGLLGIATLLLHVPVVLAAAHQGVALLLLTFALYLAYLARRQVD
jgi:cytochrome c oxidase assembly protein subunit 15